MFKLNIIAIATLAVLLLVHLFRFAVRRYFIFKNVICKNPVFTPNKMVLMGKDERRKDEADACKPTKSPRGLIAPRASACQYLRLVIQPGEPSTSSTMKRKIF